MASILRMRIAISFVYWQPWTAVLPLLGLIRVMVLRMCKVLAIPQSRSQSSRVTLVQRNKSNTVSGSEIGHTAELVRVPQCLYWCGMFFFFTSCAIVYNNNNIIINNNNNNNNNIKQII